MNKDLFEWITIIVIILIYIYIGKTVNNYFKTDDKNKKTHIVILNITINTIVLIFLIGGGYLFIEKYVNTIN